MNQEESEHNEFDGMKKGVDSTGKVVMTAASITNQMSGDSEDAMFTGSDFSSMRTPDNVTKRLKTWYFMVQCLGILQPIRKIIFAVFTLCLNRLQIFLQCYKIAFLCKLCYRPPQLRVLSKLAHT